MEKESDNINRAPLSIHSDGNYGELKKGKPFFRKYSGLFIVIFIILGIYWLSDGSDTSAWLFFSYSFFWIAYLLYKWKEARRIKKEIERNNFIASLDTALDSLPKFEIFYPSAEFYLEYKKNNIDGLHLMSKELFRWLCIKPNDCIIDFLDEDELKDKPEQEKSAAGIYKTVQNDNGEYVDAIFINLKYKKNPFAVGAILAHEMMHLYLRRKQIGIDDTLSNELLTDIATIRTGLSLLIINGMSYTSRWFFTILAAFGGVLYMHEEEVTFGYFSQKEYSSLSVEHLKNKKITIVDVLGCINPKARKYLGISLYKRSKNPTAYIKKLENRHLFILYAQISFFIGLLFLVIWLVNS